MEVDQTFDLSDDCEGSFESKAERLPARSPDFVEHNFKWVDSIRIMIDPCWIGGLEKVDSGDESVRDFVVTRRWCQSSRTSGYDSYPDSHV